MYQFILKENVLTDNILSIPSKGKIFKGGYIAIIQEYVFANAWSDRPLVSKKFRSQNSLQKYLDKFYPDFDGYFEGTCIN
jgi:hypothetical protein